LKIRRRRSLIVAQGCFNPGFRGKTDPTLKAFANADLANAFSVEFLSPVCPRVVASSNPGFRGKTDPTLKAFANADLANAFSVEFLSPVCPRVVASSNPGLKLANAFGVSSN
jgi:transposase-like protein